MLTVIDQVGWVAADGLAADLSYGRYPDGGEDWILFGAGMEHPVSPGTNNSPVSNTDESIPALKPILNVYPNPGRDNFRIIINNAKGSQTVRIYNLKGQIVRELITNETSKASFDGLDRQGRKLNSGIYFVKTEVNGSPLLCKICILN